MPLFDVQIATLNEPDTEIKTPNANTEKPGSKVWDHFENCKNFRSIQEDTTSGAIWTDLTLDFERGYLGRIKPLPTINDAASGKMGPQEGTPEKESSSRVKVPATAPFAKAQ